jgi:hypothetical protein
MSSDHALLFVVVSAFVHVTFVVRFVLSLETGILAGFLIQASNKLRINLSTFPTSNV